MNKIILALLTLVAIQTFTFGQQEAKTTEGKTVLLYDNGTWFYTDSIPLYGLKTASIKKLEIPKTNSKDKIITHTGYSLLYNEANEQASWIAYDLSKEETTKVFERTDKFIPDPMVKTGSACDKDYEGSGYDRGHLAPAADMGWSSTAMAESFYYSNMSPQKPSFNRGIWKKLEELVRAWAIENDSVYIVTGPVLTKGLPTIGPNKVSVPKYYYKVVLDYREPGIKGIGFILPNSGSKESLQHYAVSIDSVEHLTGIDFFPKLEDKQEETIEKTLCFECWSWKNLKTTGHHDSQINSDTSKSDSIEVTKHSNEPTKSTATSVQCTGTTKSGRRCRRMTRNSNRRCYQH